MPRYRVDFMQDMFCYIQADSVEDAYKKFINVEEEIDYSFNEYAVPERVEIVSPDGAVTPVEA